ncbi:MAG: type II/IV secretion system protein [Patescibacteria group bacterium]|nr:type II/IV secretion system protein [Patescibacteria group bacterium]
MDNDPQDKQKELEETLKRIREESDEKSAQQLADQLGLPYSDLRQTAIMVDALKLIPEDKAHSGKIAAIQINAGQVALIVLDPRAPEAKQIIDDLNRVYKLKVFVVSPKTLEEAWSFYRLVPKRVVPITGKIEIEREYFEGLLKTLVNVQSARQEIESFDFKKFAIAKLVQIILAGALANRASDIHTEPKENSATIRYRIDGVLHDIVTDFPMAIYDSLITRFKLLSNMKLNIHDQAQDGRFTIILPSKEVEVRVSIIPSEFGESIVMRILDPDAIQVKLADLGLRPDDLKIADEQIHRPYGLILNTGPTGSGKTTTLYAFLRALTNPEIKIITVEDPIEYRVEGIAQTQVNPETGYTFANGLRAILRQDPDVILIGEVRDKETAEIALQSALTGHIVFSTLHTNDAVGAVPRLLDLGIKPMTIGPALSLIIAQRLVRKLCVHCRKPVEVSAEFKEKAAKFLNQLPSRVDRAPYSEIKLFEAVGCDKCNGTGYKGRLGVFEFFLGSRELEILISDKFSDVDLQKLAKKQEMVTLQQDGILKAITGITTLQEVEENTGSLKWEESNNF